MRCKWRRRNFPTLSFTSPANFENAASSCAWCATMLKMPEVFTFGE
jgi:hypothetical protein